MMPEPYAPEAPFLESLLVALAVARAARNQLCRNYEASQRAVTRLRLAVARAEKAVREKEAS